MFNLDRLGDQGRTIFVIDLRNRVYNFFAIENAGKSHENFRRTRRASARAVADTVAVLA